MKLLGNSHANPAVFCPECRSDYGVHIESVEVDQLGDVTGVTNLGTFIYERPLGATFVRGSIVRIIFQCESSHRFTWKLQFHKGIVMFEREELADVNPVTDLGCLKRD